MLETLFGLVRKSRLVEAQADLALVKAGEAEANDRISRLVRERNALSSEVIEQKRLVTSLRQSILANSQEYSRVCAKVVELSDTVRELTAQLDAKRNDEANYQTAKDFLVGIGASGNLCSATSALSMIARNLSRQSGMPAITIPSANNSDEGVLAFDKGILREAVAKPQFKRHMKSVVAPAGGARKHTAEKYVTAIDFLSSRKCGWTYQALGNTAAKLAKQRSIKLIDVPQAANKKLVRHSYPESLLKEIIGEE